jgi:hypothetical protein
MSRTMQQDALGMQEFSTMTLGGIPLRRDVGLSAKIRSRFFIKNPRTGRQDTESISVTSSNLVFLNYSTTDKTLTARFRSGHIYAYTGVPVNIWQSLKKAGSIGVYFYHNIRMKYPYRKIK